MDSWIHIGDKFEVWKKREAWFWRVFNVEPSGAAIGAAASEAEAVREARLYIEESMSARRASPSCTGKGSHSRPRSRYS